LKGIAHTAFLAAFANANDKRHRWAVHIGGEIGAPLRTCEAMLAETALHLESTATVFARVRRSC